MAAVVVVAATVAVASVEAVAAAEVRFLDFLRDLLFHRRWD